MKRLQLLIAAVILTILIVVAVSNDKPAFGSAPDGVVAQVRSTATSSIGIYTASTLYASSTASTPVFCSSRVITTGANSVTLSFDTAFTPTTGNGHLQATATTEVYDSGLFGCGPIKVISNSATSTITVTEFR